MTDKINLADKFALFDTQWSPKIIANVDDYDIRIARIEGEFDWHSHQHADEMFLVIRGEFVMEYRDRKQNVGMGEMIVVPKGTEHRPIAKNGEVQVMLFEKSDTRNTGDGAITSRTIMQMERI
ncbi:hypothetical protein MNBD_ALPHA06-203 [hydrothermal vent metagenome]|uniref:Cupin type-2 domain-containing protein n=1 Tax=hydrothermal vent metagenome TaxID=652676 RepID=A0A3B0RL22_9ZZZZ